MTDRRNVLEEKGGDQRSLEDYLSPVYEKGVSLHVFDAGKVKKRGAIRMGRGGRTGVLESRVEHSSEKRKEQAID